MIELKSDFRNAPVGNYVENFTPRVPSPCLLFFTSWGVGRAVSRVDIPGRILLSHGVRSGSPRLLWQIRARIILSLVNRTSKRFCISWSARRRFFTGFLKNRVWRNHSIWTIVDREQHALCLSVKEFNLGVALGNRKVSNPLCSRHMRVFWVVSFPCWYGLPSASCKLFVFLAMASDNTF